MERKFILGVVQCCLLFIEFAVWHSINGFLSFLLAAECSSPQAQAAATALLLLLSRSLVASRRVADSRSSSVNWYFSRLTNGFSFSLFDESGCCLKRKLPVHCCCLSKSCFRLFGLMKSEPSPISRTHSVGKKPTCRGSGGGKRIGKLIIIFSHH